MRDDLALDYDRPSRVSRVVILLSTLAVAAIAIWVFTPILRANYNAYTSARTAGPQPAAPRTAVPTALVRSMAPSSDTTASTVPSASAAPPAIPPALRNFNARGGNAWPTDPPAVSLPPAYAAVNDPPATSAIAAPATSAIAPPHDPPLSPPARTTRPEANAIQLAAVSAPAAAEAADVPLPRARPSRLIAARLAIPLPRPRPDIPGDPPAAPSTFDLTVDRMR